jgi:hypothetical protein
LRRQNKQFISNHFNGKVRIDEKKKKKTMWVKSCTPTRYCSHVASFTWIKAQAFNWQLPNMSDQLFHRVLYILIGQLAKSNTPAVIKERK